MKTVFDSDQIAHVWAHKQSPHGRSASALSFSGPVLFSYSIVFTEDDREVCDPENRQKVGRWDEWIYTVTSAMPEDFPAASYSRSVRAAAKRYDRAKEADIRKHRALAKKLGLKTP